MSTYLVAFANGDFVHLESSYQSPLSGKIRPLRLYGRATFLCHIPYLTSLVSATPNLIHQGQFALDVKAKVLPIYESMFEIEYPLPKLDTLGKKSLISMSR